MQIAPGLRRLGTSSLINSYLVDENGLVTIVDAGLPGYWRLLEPELRAMGRSLDDVKALILTHGDSDHVGFAERLHRERGVPVYVHELDAPRLRGEAGKPGGSWGRMRLGPTVQFLVHGARFAGLRNRAIPDPRAFTAGATLDVPGSPVVIGLPGHTPGSVAFHFPTLGALFVGDALTTRSVLTGEVGPQTAPFTADPVRARESLSQIEAIPARLILPGHGDAWTGGVADLVARIRARP